MSSHTLSLLCAAAALTFAACDRKAGVVESSTADPVAQTKTLETLKLGSAIDAYERNATAENLASVKKAMADLDGELAELDGHIARTEGTAREEAALKLRDLRNYRDAENARFLANQTKAGVPVTTAERPGDLRTTTEKAEDSGARVADKVEDGARKLGDAIQDAGQKAADAIGNAVQ